MAGPSADGPSVYETYADIIALSRQPEPAAFGDWIVVAPIATGLITAALLIITAARDRLQVWLAMCAFASIAVFEGVLLAKVFAQGPIVMTMSDWRPPFGIAFTVDGLGAAFGFVASIAALMAAIYGLGDASRSERRFGFYPLMLMLLTGVLGAFHTGDLFNLYVWFEVLLISSFGLIVLGGRPRQLDGALRYCILNFLATTVFLIATGLLYGALGTLNMADIAARMIDPPANMPVATIGALFLFGFGMKAAAFPLNAWLPASYHTPATVTSALFAGLLTKVGVYALLRTVGTLYPSLPPGLMDVLVWIGAATAIVGALGALAQGGMRRIVASLVVSGIGLMLIGIGLGSAGGIEGAIAYALHSIVAMTALFLLVGVMVRLGPDDLARAGGLYVARPLLAAAFLAVAFSTAGLPPFSGFWPKVALVDAAIGGDAWFAVAAILGSGILTTIALGRVFAFAFWRPREVSDETTEEAVPEATTPLRSVLVYPALALSAMIVVMGLWPRLMFDPARLGAVLVLDPAGYIEIVFPDGRPGLAATGQPMMAPLLDQPTLELAR